MTVETMKVLICDDSMLARKKIKTALSQIGVTQVFEASDGEQAIAVFKDKRPDITLMDIVMPKIDGVEALKAILAEDPKAKVVMASSVGTQENLKEAIKAGAFDFLQKPVSEDQIKSLISKTVK
ncbi:MAG: response regulator [Oscillospiraceae bacterium]|nr:response regulator [Oscillospiraceae bacterium]